MQRREAVMIAVLDTTLREGEQTPGVFFDSHVKMAIAERLDRIGIDIIEAGHPAVSEEIADGLRRIVSCSLQARIGAHSRSLKRDVDLALECGVGFLGIFFCVGEERLRDCSRTLNQAIDLISETIAYARSRKPDLLIRYTPEDTVRSPLENVLSASREAVRAGADIISVADTTGHLIPGSARTMSEWVRRLRGCLDYAGLEARIAVHCHNDRGLALANALDGYQAGADIIDASVLGLGERAGITDLASLLAVLSQDFPIDNHWQLAELPGLYQLVSRYADVPIPVNHPVCGRNAFTHCAGVHIQAALKNPLHYQSLAPEPFGLTSQIALDHMSGMAALQFSLEKIGVTDLDRDLQESILAKVKDVGQHGRTVDLNELRWIVSYQKEKVKAKVACVA
jgi:2-isopropylmalate synthase